MTDIAAFIHARLDEDEQVAREAVGKRGREAGATVQHWRWELGEDAVPITDGTGPVSAEHCYSEEVAPGTVDGTARLATVELYPSRVADWQLPDIPLPGVEEPHADAARHIARHDPARVLRQVAALREVVKECETLIHRPALVSEGFIAAEQILASLAAAYGWSAVGSEGGKARAPRTSRAGAG